MGLRPAVLFIVAGTLTAAYVCFDLWVSGPWRAELERTAGPIVAWVVPIFLAYIPAVVIGFFLFTLLFAPTAHSEIDVPTRGWPSLTVVIAAWNEESAIAATVAGIAGARYPGRLEVVLADNNSTDATAARGAAAAAAAGLHYRRVPEATAGKHFALNRALETVTTEVVVTVDADTFLHEQALQRLVARLAAPRQGQHVAACAGALFVENADRTIITRMQRWDYLLGINGVKRMQAAYNTTLVAQGAFSAYWVDDLRAVGGWPDAIGEDIVLTWSLLSRRGIVTYEPLAAAFTVVPETEWTLASQRSRWARGMFEGLRQSPPYRQPRVLAKFVAGIDYLVPFLDVGYVFFWVPGFVLFLTGNPIIFGWWSMLMIPVTLIIFTLLRRWQERHVSDVLELGRAHDRGGFWAYLFAYQPLTSLAALRGYGQFALGRERHWH